MCKNDKKKSSSLLNTRSFKGRVLNDIFLSNNFLEMLSQKSYLQTFKPFGVSYK